MHVAPDNYQPPLGLLGRVAEATVRDFVQRQAQAILVEARTDERASAPS
jgi:hypothetical protein